jgi:hypothetical protein
VGGCQQGNAASGDEQSRPENFPSIAIGADTSMRRTPHSLLAEMIPSENAASAILDLQKKESG